MLVRWNPLTHGGSRSLLPELESFLAGANELARASFDSDAAVLGPWTRQSTWVPAAEVSESECEVAVHVDLPGHEAKDIQVRVEGDTLTIASERRQEKEIGKAGSVRSERSYGMFARSFVLPTTVDSTRCEAQLQNGVLSVTFPKREEAKPRTIAVKVQT